MLYTHLPYHNDSIKETDACRKIDAGTNDARTKTQEGRRKKTSLEKYSPLTLLQGSKGWFKVCM